jgi:hypothetical protein
MAKLRIFGNVIGCCGSTVLGVHACSYGNGSCLKPGTA